MSSRGPEHPRRCLHQDRDNACHWSVSDCCRFPTRAEQCVGPLGSYGGARPASFDSDPGQSVPAATATKPHHRTQVEKKSLRDGTSFELYFSQTSTPVLPLPAIFRRLLFPPKVVFDFFDCHIPNWDFFSLIILELELLSFISLPSAPQKRP